jgi:tetratricopeptide (TPR) repeat protein
MFKTGILPRWLAIAGTGVLGFALLWIVVAKWRRSLPPDPTILTAALRAQQEHRPDDAFRLAQEYLVKSPTSATARYIAAQAAHQRRQPEQALEILAEVLAEDSSADAVQCAILAGNICLERGRAWTAESHYRQALIHAPQDVTANRQMAFLLSMEGRRWESRPYLLELVNQRKNFAEELFILGDIWPNLEFPGELDRLRKERPQDPLPLLALGRRAAYKQETAKARDMLREVISVYPDLVEAHAWLGWTWVQDRQGAATLAAWEKKLPANASDHPMIWVVRGMGAEHLGQREAAARCFWEALRRDPNYDLAAYRLFHALGLIQQTEAASIVGRRADTILELATLLKTVQRDKIQETPTFRKIAETMESLGRLREAWAWYHLIAAQDPSQGWASAEAERLQERSKGVPYLSLAEAQPDLLLDFSRFPLPQWPEAVLPAATSAKSESSSAVRFIDSAAAAGIDFTYFNGDEPGNARILGNLGGGVGVVDYDGDLWPDLYFTQGAEWPVNTASTTHQDRLYRNLGNGKFEDVTQAAGLGDNSYSHGISVGDFDNDGFPDLYLANCGVNRLYHNNGDGTFTDIAPLAGITSSEWTASCLVADLSGDGLPDLFDVNYLGGDALTRRCPHGEPCQPHLFPGQQDRLLLNWGDGTFRDITRAAGINGKNGKGLGIVAADFAAAGRLGLFVANDTTPNFFYEIVTPQREPVPRFSENGVLSGLAYDGNGLAQACMGVAVDDATGDGFLELFVTNFYNESNTFYFPDVPGKIYSDRTGEFGLREGSLKMLGFGAQFIDGELDGWPDLIITNGHVQDRTKDGFPYKMRPQYYRNMAGEVFEELAPDSLGPFFHQKLLGRGLAKLDWNRDGREDVAISHIGAPAALLTNQTNPAGHFLALQLRGTIGSRDAIGATARLKLGERTITRQLTAGDGYQASNQRQLVFGLGTADRIDQLEIAWPGGSSQTFKDLPVDEEYIVIEGRNLLVKLLSPRD